MMLHFDTDNFVVVNNIPNNKAIYKSDKTLKSMQSGRLDVDEVELKIYKDSLVAEYSLVAKRNITLEFEHEKYHIRAGEAVLKGNHNLFFGKNDCYFLNSYFPNIVVNIMDNSANVEIKNSLFFNKSEIDADKDINLVIDGDFFTNNANIGIRLEEDFKFLDRKYSLKALLFSSLKTYDAQATLSQKIPFYDRKTQYNYPDIYLESLGLVENTEGVHPQITYTTISSLFMSDVKFSPNINMFLDNKGGNSVGKECIINITNTSFEAKDSEQNTLFYLCGKHTGIRDLKIITDCRKINNFVYNECYLAGSEDKPNLEIVGKSADNGESIMFLYVESLRIEMGNKASLKIKGREANSQNTDCNIVMQLADDTHTVFNTNKFINCKNIYVENNILPKMIINTHIICNDSRNSQKINLIDSILDNAEIMLEGSLCEEVNIKDSLIKKAKIKLIDKGDLCIDINKGHCILERVDFKEDSKLIIKHNSIKNVIKISDVVFSKSSRTNIINGYDKIANIKNVVFKGENLSKEVRLIDSSTLDSNNLSHIDVLQKSDISRCNLSNISEIIDLKVADAYFNFNIKGRLFPDMLKGDERADISVEQNTKGSKIKRTDIDLF